MGGRAVGEEAVGEEAVSEEAVDGEAVDEAAERGIRPFRLVAAPLRVPPLPPLSLPPLPPFRPSTSPPACQRTYSRSPSRPPSRPKPLSRYPPNPLAASNTLVQFTQTVPAFICGATSRARLMFSVQMLAARP